MSLTYSTYVSQLSNLMVIPSTDANFQTFLPGCIDYAEQRMYRELDLLATVVTDSTNFVSGQRNLTLPTNTGTYLVVQTLNTITPVTAGTTDGTRVPALFVAPEVIDSIYPSNSNATGTPEFAAMVNNTTLIVGPAPDAAYTVEIRGTQRPTALSSTNTATILTAMLPDAFIAASMVFASGYMRDFSNIGDNPQMGAAWELQYKTLVQSADAEEFRKKYQSQAWTTQQPNQIATPPRV